jgi:predicted GNAT family N-acyltransferase
MIQIKHAVNEEDRNKCYALRLAVFVEEQGVPLDMELDEHDETDAVHIMGCDEGEVVATARMVNLDGVGKIGRVAVAQSARGKGYGKQVIEALMNLARDAGTVSSFALDAQIQATGLYEKLGFEKVGDVFDDAGIDHIKMVRGL